jgi:hypothetical protein
MTRGVPIVSQFYRARASLQMDDLPVDTMRDRHIVLSEPIAGTVKIKHPKKYAKSSSL